MNVSVFRYFRYVFRKKGLTTRRDETTLCKARQGKARQGKARQGKARQGKARQGKARQGIVRCFVIFVNPFSVNFVRPGGENPQKGILLPAHSYTDRSIAQTGMIFNGLWEILTELNCNFFVSRVTGKQCLCIYTRGKPPISAFAETGGFFACWGVPQSPKTHNSVRLRDFYKIAFSSLSRYSRSASFSRMRSTFAFAVSSSFISSRTLR